MNIDPIEVSTTVRGAHVEIGLLYPQRNGGGIFRYDDTWISDPHAYALAPSVPLQRGALHLSAARGRLPQAFSDSAPDRWGRGVIERTWRAEGKGMPDDVGYLLGVNDHLRMGALRYSIAGNICTLDSRVPKLVDLSQLEAASRRTERDDESLEDLSVLLRAASSLGGARPKASIIDERGHLMMAKFTSTKDDDAVVAWEKVCLDIAERSGITTPRSRLLHLSGRPVLLMDRFDRTYSSNGSHERVPYMSAMTLLNRTDGDTSSMVTIAEEYQAIAGRDAKAALTQLWSRAALNLMVGNTDNHLRNHGFVRTATGWSPSPVFDVTPASGKKDFAVHIDEQGTDSLDTLLSVSDYFELDHAQALEHLALITDSVDQWRNLARRYDIPPRQDRHVEAGFNGPARDEARTILGDNPTVLDLASRPEPASTAMCEVCGRPLRSEESIARGTGPKCATK